MSLLLDKTKKTLENMFESIKEVLEDSRKSSSINDDSFQIKIAIFRNYSSSSDLILEVNFTIN